MRVYSHQDNNTHQPLPYFSYGQMRQPLEIPKRLDELLKAPKALGIEIIGAEDCGINPILDVHDYGYVEFLKNGYDEWRAIEEDLGDQVQTGIYVPNNNPGLGIMAKAAKYQSDDSAPIAQGSWNAIYWSAQTALTAAQALLKSDLNDNEIHICLSRPPGHHASKSSAGGFCYLNNAAIIAQYLLQTYSKIAIVDTDMHHGQGVQDIFYDRKDVLYTSVHGSPINFYPAVTGHEFEKGSGEGYGFNLNFPMPHGASETDFFSYVDQSLEAVKLYNPDVVVHILGFDVYEEDPETKCSVSTQGFEILAKKIKAINKPLIVLVEGGYYIEKLNQNMQSFLKGLMR